MKRKRGSARMVVDPEEETSSLTFNYSDEDALDETMSLDSDYVCTLDEASIKKAKSELNENPQDRMAAVQALRDWVKEQPHIKCPELDTLTLLKLLRGAKFSQIRAREMIEGNFSLKTKAPEVFLDIDTHDPKIMELLNTGYVVPLPKRTDEGHQVLLYRMSKLDRKDFKLDIKQMFRAANIVIQYISVSEMTQVNGCVFLMDFTGIGPKFITKMMGSDMQKWQKLFQTNTPGRYKGFHYYNCGVIFDILMAFARPLFPKKWVDRIQTHENLSTVFPFIPEHCMPLEYLSDDYTGEHVGYIDDLLKNFLAEIQEETFRKSLLHLTSMAYSIDESKRPQMVTSHFRKLNID